MKGSLQEESSFLDSVLYKWADMGIKKRKLKQKGSYWFERICRPCRK